VISSLSYLNYTVHFWWYKGAGTTVSGITLNAKETKDVATGNRAHRHVIGGK